jgi:hypothetical protein
VVLGEWATSETACSDGIKRGGVTAGNTKTSARQARDRNGLADVGRHAAIESFP